MDWLTVTTDLEYAARIRYSTIFGDGSRGHTGWGLVRGWMQPICHGRAWRAEEVKIPRTHGQVCSDWANP